MARTPKADHWYKWHPYRAAGDATWNLMRALPWPDGALLECLYRRLYDVASMVSPASRRGKLVHRSGRSLTEVELAVLTAFPIDEFKRLLEIATGLTLIVQTRRGVWYFPSFAKHQRNSPSRVRTHHSLPETDIPNGTILAHKWRLEEDKEKEIEADKERERTRARLTPELRSQLDRDAEAFLGHPLLTRDNNVIDHWAEAYPPEWCRAAMAGAKAKGVVTLDYATGFLRRYAAQGGPDPEPACRQAGPAGRSRSRAAEIREALGVQPE